MVMLQNRIYQTYHSTEGKVAGSTHTHTHTQNTHTHPAFTSVLRPLLVSNNVRGNMDIDFEQMLQIMDQ